MRRIIGAAMKIATKSKKVNKAWLHDHVNDPYVKLAQREGYRARAAYKLKEIDEQLQPARARASWWSTSARRRAPGASTCGASSRRARAATGGAAGALNGTHHRARHAAVRADRGRRLHPGRLPRGRGAGAARSACSPAGRSTWCSRTWRPTCRASQRADAARMAHLVELAVDFAQQPPEARRRAGRARCFTAAATASSSKLFKDDFQDRQADQAQGLARQVGRDLSGRHRSQSRRASRRRYAARSDGEYSPCSVAMPWAPGLVVDLKSAADAVDGGADVRCRVVRSPEMESR